VLTGCGGPADVRFRFASGSHSNLRMRGECFKACSSTTWVRFPAIGLFTKIRGQEI